MTQEKLLVSSESFKVLKTITDYYTNGKISHSDELGVFKKEHFGMLMNNHHLEIHKKQTLKKGDWYIHAESGQEKMIFVIIDAEKQLFSGWDCKGKFFSKEWLFLGNRFNKINASTAVSLLNNKNYDFNLVREELKDIYTEEYQEKNERIIVDEFLTENPFVGYRVQFKSKNNIEPEINGNIYKLPSGDNCMAIYKNKNTVELIPGNTTQKIELKPGDIIEFVRKQNIFR